MMKIKTMMLTLLAAFAAGAGAARAAAPVALVEEVTGSPGVESMDYVEPGKVIKLAAGDQVTLSYIKSCWRETIRGGTVTVGAEQSAVEGGKVERAKVACDGGKMELAAEQSKQAGAMVFRAPPGRTAAPPKPQFVLYSRSPVLEVPGGGKVAIERVDAAGETLEFAFGPGELVHHAFFDLAKAGKSLTAGGIYRARMGNQQLIFQIDPSAAAGAGPIAGRLLRFQPASG
jgi:hypothetical protein